MSKAKLQFIRILVNNGYSQETADAIWNCYDFSEKKGAEKLLTFMGVTTEIRIDQK